MFKTSDIYRATITEPMTINDALKFSQEERNIACAKDPLRLREQILWLMQEMKLTLCYISITGEDIDLSEIRNRVISLIEKCYFDTFIDTILLELLSNLRIEAEQWRLIIRKIQASKVIPSQKTVESLFLQALQYIELYDDLVVFLNTSDHTALNQILHAIKDSDAQKAATYINAKQDPFFTLILLQSIVEHELTTALTTLIKITDEHQQALLYLRLKALDLNKQDKNAIDLINSFQIDKATPPVLSTIEIIAYKNKQWHLFIPPALLLLNFKIPQLYKIQLHAELATAYFHQGDDSNAIAHAEQALDHYQELGEKNSQNVLSILGQALLMKGSPDEACLYFQKYQHIKRSFSLLLEEADLYLKSSLSDKHEKALSIILRAFEKLDTYDDRMYLSAYMLLVELNNANKILLKNEPTIKDGLFVKLDGFSNGWFYISEEKNSLGANVIKPGTSNYKALINKSISEEIEWPADRYTSHKTKHKILHIAPAPTFLFQRAHEAMTNIASLGDADIWSIRIINEDGEIDQENLKHFYDEQFRPGNEFFAIYTSTPLPFSFLCKMQGGLASAIGRLYSEKKGFIRCNNGTQADIDAQKDAANEALKGQVCFMEGLSALMLAEAELLETVINTLPNLGVSTSVIRILRKIARDMETTSSSTGKGMFVEGNFKFRPRDKEGEESFRNKLLQAADLLDHLPNKVVAKTYAKLEGDKNLDHMLPNYFVDAFRYAQERNALILTDDALFVQAYNFVEKSPIPQHFSSLSLIRALAQDHHITWDRYLKYFELLSGYRYFLLPISADEIMQAIFPPAASGLITVAPNNISFLNLQLTLSHEYGVNDKTAATILSSLFIKLILDDSVTPEIADEIFAPAIVRGLAERDKKVMAMVLFQICLQNMPDKNWTSQKSKQKLDILNQQLTRFAQTIDPIMMEVPSLLRVTNPY